MQFQKGGLYLESSLGVSDINNNFYKVEAKCGHVGRGLYFKGTFYVRAKNARRAATVTRKFPRVKHDSSDAILSVTPIDYKEFISGQQNEYIRPYYNCLCKQEQMKYWDDVSRDLYLEKQDEDFDKEKKRTKKHSLNNIYNMDPLYYELKGFQGNIDYEDIV